MKGHTEYLLFFCFVFSFSFYFLKKPKEWFSGDEVESLCRLRVFAFRVIFSAGKRYLGERS